ncbi:MAG: tRNA pseudouridine(55) synthase TruB [Bacteroidetes bacterium]|nr:tRNA pseudouridine(55) synthase TruB [Bacteroidota bacterium]
MNIFRKESDLNVVSSLDGATFLVDKPKGWSSFDVVKKIRHALKQVHGRKKYKVGHAGTLDPLAKGLLIICTGKHTKQIQNFQNLDKEYEAVVKLGATTPSSDAEFPEENIIDARHLSAIKVKEALFSFQGTIKQRPPVFSAVKKDGKRLYQYARAGKDVEIPERMVKIHEIEIRCIDSPYVSFCMKCGKGTYVRSLAADLGRKLGVGGYLYKLNRTKIGAYSVADAYTVQELFDKLIDQTN